MRFDRRGVWTTHPRLLALALVALGAALRALFLYYSE